MEQFLEILFRDEFVVAVNKPVGMLIHHNKFTKNEHDNVVNLLQRQLGCQVFPVHRLDRQTAGVMLVALEKETATQVGEFFMNRKVEKEYLAVLRGLVDDEGEILEPLWRKEKQRFQSAHTVYKTLERIELPIDIGPMNVAQYSLVNLQPITGRRHQLRRHVSKIQHPIIGDKKYGDKEHNRLFVDDFHLEGMMLQAYRLYLPHPKEEKSATITVTAPLAPHISAVCKKFNWKISDDYK